MDLFVAPGSEGAYQWSHFTTAGMALVAICLLASAAVVLFCAVALRRSQWGDKDAILSVVMLVAGVVSLSIWYVLFAGQLLNYHESNIPSADRVVLFTFASLVGSLLAAVAGVVMMGVFSSRTDSGGPQRSRAAAGGRPQVTQGMSPQRGAQSGSGPNPNPGGADATAIGRSNPGAAPQPGGGSQEGTLIQSRPSAQPIGAPGLSPAAGSQEGTLIQSRPSAQPIGAPGLQEGTLLQGAAGPAGAAGSAAPPNPAAGATMAPGGAQQPGTLLHLDVVAGPAAGRSYNLQEGNNVLGRSPDSALFLDDPMVSRVHAMFRVNDGQTFLVDLGSRGGTRVGNRQIEGHALGLGETVTLGQSSMTLLFMQGTATPPAGGGGGETMVGAPPGVGMALVAQSGPDSGKVFHLRQGPNIVGRDTDADVQLSDQQVSRRHAVVNLRDERVAVSDMGSSYGTAINGRNLEETKLNLGDRVFVGQSELVLTGPGV